MSNGEIIIAPLPFSGHTFPATVLATQLASRNYQITLLLPSLPSSPLHPLIRTLQCSAAPPGPPPTHTGQLPFGPADSGPHQGPSTNDILAQLIDNHETSSPPLLCVIVDVMASQLIQVCTERGVPAASLFTSSACVTALEHTAIHSQETDIGPDGLFIVPGLPEEMALTTFNISCVSPPMQMPGLEGPGPMFGTFPPTSMPPMPPPGGGPHARPPPLPGHGLGTGPYAPLPPPPRQGPSGGPPPPPLAMGLGQTDDAIALLINTCSDLELPFLDYIAKEAKKPVLAVGPLLPSQFWSSVTGSTSVIHDESIRPKHDSTHSEHDVLNWLDSRPSRSVVYVSFGSTNTPSDVELVELAAGLEQSNWAFIWSIQSSAMKHDPAGLPIDQEEPSLFDPDDFAKRVGDRGLVIRGWAPQLLILSHESTGGFLTHCGWNSTVEALGCGMPMLTWPIHGDQIYNARLVTKWLKVGHVLKSEGQGAIKREQVLQGIPKLMTDDEIRQRVKATSKDVFGKGFPSSSADAVDNFLDLVDAKRRKCQVKLLC
ncbi:UDP-glycosyltransferase 73B1 [Carex littledalei]|uniref:Glycosyltransferase n=1 Tax=Carex littledalei TaxID=544730 RepID=A0A833QDH6_9POAL|nr:UDP-glycosyltransferase 73B1 [Carex littledalei]